MEPQWIWFIAIGGIALTIAVVIDVRNKRRFGTTKRKKIERMQSGSRDDSRDDSEEPGG